MLFCFHAWTEVGDCFCAGGGSMQAYRSFFQIDRRELWLIRCWSYREARQRSSVNVQLSPREREQQICGCLLFIRSHLLFKLAVSLRAIQTKLKTKGGRSYAKRETRPLSEGFHDLLSQYESTLMKTIPTVICTIIWQSGCAAYVATESILISAAEDHQSSHSKQSSICQFHHTDARHNWRRIYSNPQCNSNNTMNNVSSGIQLFHLRVISLSFQSFTASL